ncbi:MAG: hypothetical protein ACK5U4_23880, partial [Rhodospirillales bacterium]
MKIATKLTGLIVAAAAVSTALFGILTWQSYSGLENERRIMAGLAYSGPMREMGEAVYRHKLNMLKNSGVANPDNEGLARAKDAVRSAFDRLEALDRSSRAAFGIAPEAPGFRPAVERILALRHGPSQTAANIIEFHEATFAQYRELAFSAADAFNILGDPDVDFVLTFTNQFEVYPNVMMARAYLIGRSYAFDETLDGRAGTSPEDLQVQLDRLVQQQGVIAENLRRLVRNIARAVRAEADGRSWRARAPVVAALQERGQRLETAYLFAMRSPPVGAAMVAEEEAFLAALSEAWRNLGTLIDANLNTRHAQSTRAFYLHTILMGLS